VIKTKTQNKNAFKRFIKYLESRGVLYSVPSAATFEDWAIWKNKVKKEYPIQYSVREYTGDIWYTICRKYRATKYYLKTLLFPENKLIRNAIPVRGHDLTYIIKEMNFAAILQFREEAVKSCVDWEDTKDQLEFRNWLDTSAAWIKEGRAALNKQLDSAYPNIGLGDLDKHSIAELKELYSEVLRIEQLIEQTNETILLQMVKYRDYFWT
jgi:hypothetical protein